MTGIDLRNRMNEAIMSLPKPDAELQVVEIRELDQTWHEVIDELTYASYRHNRKLSPEITPTEWGRLFANVELLEERYQQEEMIWQHQRS